MVWKLGEMGPNDERTITLQIIPERQGEMGSTAAVRFAAQASMRTTATLPKLELSFSSRRRCTDRQCAFHRRQCTQHGYRRGQGCQAGS